MPNHLRRSAFSDFILLPASVQLPTSLTLQLGLQRGPAGVPHFPVIHVARRSAGEGNSGSELRIGSSVPTFSALYPVGDLATVSLRPSFGSDAVDLTSWFPRYSGVTSHAGYYLSS